MITDYRYSSDRWTRTDASFTFLATMAGKNGLLCENIAELRSLEQLFVCQQNRTWIVDREDGEQMGRYVPNAWRAAWFAENMH